MRDLKQAGLSPQLLQPSPANRSRRVTGAIAILALQGALVLAVVFVSLGGFDRAYRIPFDFSRDSLVTLAQSKSTFDNGWWWVNPREGVPLGLQALLFPANSNVDQAFVWVVGRVFRDALLAVNLTWVAMLVVAGWIATFGLRTLGYSRLAAFVAGTLFALSPYALYRHLGHFSLVTYLVPFPATVALLLLSARAPALGSWRSMVLLAGCALLGFNYVYYAFFACFFIALATVGGFWRIREPRVWRFGGAAFVTIIACVALNFLPSFVVAAREGTPIVVRQKMAAEAEVYGLKIRQLVSPAWHHSFPPFLAWTVRESAAQFPLETENMVSKLGLVASLGLLGLLAAPFADRRGTAGSRILSASHLTVAGLLLATVGGFGSLFNLLTVPEIRAYNRICPFIAFFALVAVAAVIDATSRRHRKWGVTIAATTLTLGIWDQAHAFIPLEAVRAATRTEYAALLSLVTRLETKVPAQSMVLQLPFTIYLNDDGHNRMLPYDHFKPYLVSRTLRWSYPALSNAQLVWQEAASQLEPAPLAALAASQGFRVLLIDRYGYPDNATAVIAELTAVPGLRSIVEEERYAAFDISGVAPLSMARGQPVHEFVLDYPMTPTLRPCNGAAQVSFDRIGEATGPLAPGTVEVSGAHPLRVSGWALTSDANQAGSDVEVTIGDDVYATYYGFERPDVAAYFNTPAAKPSEFRVVVPAARLSRGEHTLTIRVVAPREACFFESPKASIRVR